MENFKHKTPIQVRFKDTDMMGHVNNAAYATYVEYARLQYFKDVVSDGVDWSKQEGLILAKLELNFRAPLFFSEIVSVYTRCSRIGKSSFDLEWKIVREKNSKEETAAEGSAVLVCYDYATGKSVPLSEERKKKLNAYENIN